MDSPEKRGIEFYPPEEADGQPWNDLPDKSQDSAPPPPEGPVPAPAPVKAPRTVPPLAYLTALLAAGFLLMTAVCVLQFRDSQRELDEVRGALEDVQTLDALREENARLRERVDKLTATVEKAEQDCSELLASLREKVDEANLSNMKRDMLNCLWFIQNFMESGDYAMAACATAYSGDKIFRECGSFLNERQQTQYAEYRWQLVELGWLNPNGYTIMWTNGTYGVSASIEPEKGIVLFHWVELWRALKEYYIDGDAMGAARYLMDWGNVHRGEIEQERGSFAIDQYELLKETLIDQGYLAEDENGELDMGPNNGLDVFDWKIGTAQETDDGPVAD